MHRKVRDRSSYALVSVAAALGVEDGRVADVRLALGGVAHEPRRASAAEELKGAKAFCHGGGGQRGLQRYCQTRQGAADHARQTLLMPRALRVAGGTRGGPAAEAICPSEKDGTTAGARDDERSRS